MITLPNHFDKGIPGSGDLFTRILNIEGKVFRAQPSRRTLKFSHQGKTYFLKTHSGIGWKEIGKNFIQGKWPVLGAGREWEASQRLHALGVETPVPVGFGRRGRNPAHQQSFLITEDLGESLTLEEMLATWKLNDNADSQSLGLKRTLIQKVATIARTMHHHGINHCDFYLCHLRIKREDLLNFSPQRSVSVFLMDLHRAQIRTRTPRRWMIKDLGALLFSCLPYGITRRDQYRFLKGYTEDTLRNALHMHGTIWNRVQRRARRMYAKHGAPQLSAGLLTASNRQVGR